jgi:3-methylfumaryl-CoA hydratase
MIDPRDWIGRNRVLKDRLDPARSAGLCAALGLEARPAIGDLLPPLHHWLAFWEPSPPAETGVDGHPAKGGFLPPIALPRRMWAGGTVTFHRPLRLGATVRRETRIAGIETKAGRSGTLVFVTLEHTISDAQGVAIDERQDLVYREAGDDRPALPEAIVAPDWEVRYDPDPVLLFRYSALTLNSHRIHYDLPYAQAAEGYPALVVQGPLQATMLAAHAAHRLGGLRQFAFRGVAPAFAGVPLGLASAPDGDGLSLWTEQGGVRRMTATAHI